MKSKGIRLIGAFISPEKASLMPFDCQTAKATFVDCEFSGDNAWGYVNNATYEGCTFSSSSDTAAMHFDRLYGELHVKNCEFVSGKIQIGNG